MKKFTKEQNKIFSEIYRRLNYFCKGNLNEPLLHIAFPYEVKPIMGLGVITPYDGKETPRVVNWYRLTEKGKAFFQNYVTDEKLSEDENLSLFAGETIKTFDINLLKQTSMEKIEIDSKRVRGIMYLFFQERTNVLNTVTSVKVFQEQEGVTVEITTHCPGLIIGKAGVTIDALVEDLTKKLETPVNIKLKEDKMWYDIFK